MTNIKPDPYGQPIEITDGLLRTTTIERDADGQVTRITKPSDGIIPNPLPGGVGTAGPGQVITELEYDANGNVILRRKAAGTGRAH